jgi:hypothetical protein
MSPHPRYASLVAQESMVNCFIGVGLAKDPTTGEFKKYTSHRRGTLAIKKVDAGEETVAFMEQVTEIQMVQRDGAESDEDEEPEDEDEEEDDDDDSDA